MHYFGLCDGIRKLNLPDIEYLDIYEREFSKFYDNLVINDDYDLEYLNKVLNNTKEPVLELACGSGRVMIPLLEKGYFVSGVDASEDMLEILRKKSIKRNLSTNLYKDDMCSFHTDFKYAYVILSHISICLLEPQQQKELFINISKNVLKDNGKFIFNFTESSDKLMKSRELKPNYYFNMRTKSFIVFSEKVDLDADKVYINMYMEQIEKNKTKRYIGTSCKNIIKKEVLVNHIRTAGLRVSDEKSFFLPEGTITYLIVEKEKSKCYND